MTFPKNSAFSQKRGSLDITPYEPIIGSTKRLDVAEVPNQTLERWYAVLNDFVATARRTSGYGNGADLPQEIEDLRDEVYSYLRG
jgi:hypothetical protein